MRFGTTIGLALAPLLVAACNLASNNDPALRDAGDANDVEVAQDAHDVADADGGADDELVDVEPELDASTQGSNACGGAATLRYRGDARGPGDRCGCTGTIVCAGPDALRCANDVGNNACGGCGVLAGLPGSDCGACGGGRWECADGSVECDGALLRNLCGGCALLAGAPTAPCAGPFGSRWECAGADTVVCALPERNACGSFGELLFDGVDAAPGDACEAACGVGRLLCDPSTGGLFCDGPEANECGSCEPLSGTPGTACGCGGAGRWVCDGAEVECVGGDTNACGGCAGLAVRPGAACVDGGLRICVSVDATACVALGAGSNFCGGEVALESLPGGSCGACESGTFACLGPDQVGCDGDGGAAAFNACGGCERLIGVQGDPCGVCGGGTLVCSGANALVCDGDPGAAARNACGGCGELSATPDTPCGECATWRCVGAGVQCAADPRAEGCGQARVTCDELGCAAERRACTEATTTTDASCGACLEGAAEVDGVCVDGPYCGDGELNGVEECDGAVPVDVSCATLGFTSGTPACTTGCTLDTSGCRRLPDAPDGVEASTTRPLDVEIIWSAVEGATAYEVEIDASGVWTRATGSVFDDTTAPAPSLTACRADASDGTSATQVVLECTGDAVAPGASRSYRVRAVGAGGTGPASVAVSGHRTAGVRSYQWQRSAADSDAAYSNLGGPLSSASATDTMSGVTPPAGRRYLVVISAVGAADVESTSDRGYIAALPGVTTSVVATGTIGETSAVLGGAVSSLGGAAELTDHGFCVGPSTNPAPGGSGVRCSSLGATGAGSFSETFSGLTASTTYFVRAFAENIAGRRYGTSRSFTTLAPLAALGEPCADSAECASGACATAADDPANHRCVPSVLSEAGGGGLEFRYVPSGSFLQGDILTPGSFTAIVARPYFVASTEVTQGQWKVATEGVNNSCFQTPTATSCGTENANDTGPASPVDWWSAAAFANWLSENDGDDATTRCYVFTPTDWDRDVAQWADGSGIGGATGVVWLGPSCTGYRLLSESEWEWAVGGGPPPPPFYTFLTYHWGFSDADAGEYAWFDGNSAGRTHEVGTRLPNGYGIYDLAGNVREWVWDWWGAYPGGSQVDYFGPTTPTPGEEWRMHRGGSWDYGTYQLSSQFRNKDPAGHRDNNLGIRLARTVPGASGLPAGAACASNAECASGSCLTSAAEPLDRRCLAD
ncbi:MAG: SUMF1/EgtB/PvdO family nonheme iron enzyme [Myxococcales bacterium]|nr:SUMF1/EgtB/PvdO family nonheme iron enzyme [Myxococcales bacterium]